MNHIQNIKHLLIALVSTLLIACGGGGGGGGGGEGDGGSNQNDIAANIVGTWLGACANVIDAGSGIAVNTRSTATYNADGTTSDFTDFYSDSDCTTLKVTSPIRKSSSGTYSIGAATTTSDGRAVHEIDVIYTVSELDGVNLLLAGPATIINIVRVDGDTLLAGEWTPIAADVRPNTLNDAVPMTRQ